LQGVVGEADRRGESSIPFGVEGLVGEVSEPGLACLDILGDLDGLGDGEVGGVGFLSESVDDQDGDTLDEIANGWRDGSAIG